MALNSMFQKFYLHVHPSVDVAVFSMAKRACCTGSSTAFQSSAFPSAPPSIAMAVTRHRKAGPDTWLRDANSPRRSLVLSPNPIRRLQRQILSNTIDMRVRCHHFRSFSDPRYQTSSSISAVTAHRRVDAARTYAGAMRPCCSHRRCRLNIAVNFMNGPLPGRPKSAPAPAMFSLRSFSIMKLMRLLGGSGRGCQWVGWLTSNSHSLSHPRHACRVTSQDAVNIHLPTASSPNSKRFLPSLGADSIGCHSVISLSSALAMAAGDTLAANPSRMLGSASVRVIVRQVSRCVAYLLHRRQHRVGDVGPDVGRRPSTSRVLRGASACESHSESSSQIRYRRLGHSAHPSAPWLMACLESDRADLQRNVVVKDARPEACRMNI